MPAKPHQVANREHAHHHPTRFDHMTVRRSADERPVVCLQSCRGFMRNDGSVCVSDAYMECAAPEPDRAHRWSPSGACTSRRRRRAGAAPVALVLLERQEQQDRRHRPHPLKLHHVVRRTPPAACCCARSGGPSCVGLHYGVRSELRFRMPRYRAPKHEVRPGALSVRSPDMNWGRGIARLPASVRPGKASDCVQNA